MTYYVYYTRTVVILEKTFNSRFLRAISRSLSVPEHGRARLPVPPCATFQLLYVCWVAPTRRHTNWTVPTDENYNTFLRCLYIAIKYKGKIWVSILPLRWYLSIFHQFPDKMVRIGNRDYDLTEKKWF